MRLLPGLAPLSVLRLTLDPVWRFAQQVVGRMRALLATTQAAPPAQAPEREPVAPAVSHPPRGRDRIRQGLNVVLASAQLVAITWAMRTPFGAVLDERGEAPPVVPADYAFGIWGYIYPASLVYALYAALPAHRERPLLRRVGFWTAGAYLAMTLWAVCVGLGWYLATIGCIFVMLVALVGAFAALLGDPTSRTFAEEGLVVLPISVHLGWITVATVANTASVLSGSGVDDLVFSGQVWALGLLVVAGLIATWVTWVSRGNAGYAFTILWALVGIIVTNGGGAPNSGVVLVATSVALLVAVTWWRARPHARYTATRRETA